MNESHKASYFYPECKFGRACPNCGGELMFGIVIRVNVDDMEYEAAQGVACLKDKEVWTEKTAPRDFLTKDRKNWKLVINLKD